MALPKAKAPPTTVYDTQSYDLPAGMAEALVGEDGSIQLGENTHLTPEMMAAVQQALGAGGAGLAGLEGLQELMGGEVDGDAELDGDEGYLNDFG